MKSDNWFTAPAGDDPRHGKVLAKGNDTRWCPPCGLIHHVDLPCAVVAARVMGVMVEIGDELGDDELEGVDRPELLAALRLRGISVDSDGKTWRAVVTVPDTRGIPVHVEDDDTAPLSGNGR